MLSRMIYIDARFGHFNGSFPNHDIGGDQAFCKARAWYDECLDHCRDCDKVEDNLQYPSKLVDISAAACADVLTLVPMWSGEHAQQQQIDQICAPVEVRESVTANSP